VAVRRAHVGVVRVVELVHALEVVVARVHAGEQVALQLGEHRAADADAAQHLVHRLGAVLLRHDVRRERARRRVQRGQVAQPEVLVVDHVVHRVVVQVGDLGRVERVL